MCGIVGGERTGLGHRRLAIIDLSDAGRQSMTVATATRPTISPVTVPNTEVVPTARQP